MQSGISQKLSSHMCHRKQAHACDKPGRQHAACHSSLLHPDELQQPLKQLVWTTPALLCLGRTAAVRHKAAVQAQEEGHSLVDFGASLLFQMAVAIGPGLINTTGNALSCQLKPVTLPVSQSFAFKARIMHRKEL